MDFFSCYNLSKSFDEEVVFKNMHINFPQKGIVSICGPSGCGKSTLMNCLIGLEKVQGEIVFLGKKIKDFNLFRNQNVGVIFQNFHLFEYLSVRDNINLFNNSHEFNKIVKLLGLEDKLDFKVSLLSGGEKQRVAIARTLMKKPKIIFCDEITGSLDEETSIIIMDYLKILSKDILIINISHNQKLVDLYSSYILNFNKINGSYDFRDYNFEKFKTNNSIIKIKSLFNHSFNLMKKSRLKIFLTSFSLLISITFCGVIINSKQTISQYFYQYKSSALDYNFLDLSVNETIKIQNSSFSLIKQERPSNLEEIQEMTNLSIGYNYSNLINSYFSLTNGNKELSNITFLPCLNLEIKNYNQVIANDFAYQLINSNRIIYSNNNQIDYFTKENKVISDNFSIDIIFEIVGINHEMDFIKEPVLYYSYYLFEEYLEKIHLVNISSYFNRNISLAKRIQDFTFEGDIFNTGSIYLICQEKQEVEKTIDLFNKYQTKEKYICQSRSLSNYQSLILLMEKIVDAVEIFLVLSLLISFFLLAICLNSLIIDEEKELSILMGLGVLKQQVNQIVQRQIWIILIKVFLFSLFLKQLSYFFLNQVFNFLNFLFFENLIYENFIILVMILIVVLIFNILKRILITNLKISKILKEE